MEAPRLAEPELAGELGERLRRRRQVRRLALKEVAGAAGVSIAQLSQIERGRSQPSLRSLRAICAALEMPVGWLFEGEGPEDAVVVRADARRRFALGANGIAKELLTGDACRGAQMMRIVLPPDSASGARPFELGGAARCGLVLEGALGLEVDGARRELESGDSFAFEGRERCRFWCASETPCVVIWVVAPAIY